MKYIRAIILFVVFVFIIINYNFEYDAANPKLSLHRIMYFMTMKQKMNFLKEIDFLCDDRICSNLDGLTKNDIHDLYVKSTMNLSHSK